MTALSWVCWLWDGGRRGFGYDDCAAVITIITAAAVVAVVIVAVVIVAIVIVAIVIVAVVVVVSVAAIINTKSAEKPLQTHMSAHYTVHMEEKRSQRLLFV